MTDTPIAQPAEQPLVADRPSFWTDVRKGLKDALKTAWKVPAAQGLIATQIVRFVVWVGLPGALGSVAVAILDKLAQ
jgi:hypothetical protein